MSSSSGADAGYEFEFLPEVQGDANRLDAELRRVIAELVVELHRNPYLGELMDERWPHNLEGSRNIRFDKPGWKRKPRYRLVYRNEPTDGAVAKIVVLAIDRRDNMIAYARASARLTREAAKKSRRRAARD